MWAKISSKELEAAASNKGNTVDSEDMIDSKGIYETFWQPSA